MGGSIQLAVCFVLILLALVECNPRYHPQPAFSAASYESLGIQPGDRPSRSLGQGNNKYWWQGPQSPFREGAGQGLVQSGSTSHRVIGCSGDGCGDTFNPHGVSASASVSSSYGSSSHQNAVGGGSNNCCNYYWQKPGHPCANHQGNDCPSAFSCVHFRQCVNGHMSSIYSGYTSDKPTLTELMEYGRPCGNSGTEVCCSQKAPPVTAPVYAPAPTTAPVHQYGSTYAPAPSFNPIAIHPTTAPPVQQPVYVPPPQVQQPVYVPPPPPPVQQPVYVQCNYDQECITASVCSARPGQSNTQFGQQCQNFVTGQVGVCCNPLPPPSPPPTQPVVVPPSLEYLPPVAPPPVQQPAVVAPVYKPPPPPQPAEQIYVPPPSQPPVQQPVVAPPQPVQPPVYKPPTQPVVTPVGPPANVLPYPGCAAALKCVEERFCNKEGVMVDQPVNLSPHDKEFRTPLMPCLNTETNLVGFCCRDPLYEDPWPGGMMMPGMPAKPPVAPAVVQPTQPPPPPPTQAPYVQCSFNQECVSASVCNTRFGQYSAQNTPKCQSNGQVGVCCNRPPPPPVTTTSRPLPPPPTQPVLAPPDSYVPPPFAPPKPLPPQPVVVATPPSLEYLPPVPQPPVQQPVVAPVPPPVQQPVYVPPPPVDYVPPPPPVVAAQVADSQCGASRPVPQRLNNGEAALGEFPWHAMIAQKNGTMSCSGALIGAKYIATAYHCVRGILPTNLVVRLGEQRVGANDETMPHYEIPVTAVVGHPDFAEGSLFNDMAVLMLAMAAPSGLAHISPICLPSPSEQVGPQCVASGWGHDTISGLQPGMLNKVQVQVVRNADCQSTLQSTHLGKYFKLHQSFTCASTQNSINPCKLDGGSPMACQRPDGSYVLGGLSSWSVGCGNQQQPTVFADVAPVATWINQQMNQPEASMIDYSNTAFQQQQQFQTTFGAGAGYGR